MKKIGTGLLQAPYSVGAAHWLLSHPPSISLARKQGIAIKELTNLAKLNQTDYPHIVH